MNWDDVVNVASKMSRIDVVGCRIYINIEPGIGIPLIIHEPEALRCLVSNVFDGLNYHTTYKWAIKFLHRVALLPAPTRPDDIDLGKRSYERAGQYIRINLSGHPSYIYICNEYAIVANPDCNKIINPGEPLVLWHETIIYTMQALVNMIKR